MKTVRIAAVISILGLVTLADVFAADHGPSLTSMNWLIGTWTAQGKRGSFGERWSVKDSLTFEGVGFRVNGADTVVTERTQLIQCDSGLFFVADVPENKGKVWFRLTSADSLGYLFENPRHDFPTKVCYRIVGSDSLSAWIEGPSGDQPKRIHFGYTRSK